MVMKYMLCDADVGSLAVLGECEFCSATDVPVLPIGSEFRNICRECCEENPEEATSRIGEIVRAEIEKAVSTIH